MKNLLDVSVYWDLVNNSAAAVPTVFLQLYLALCWRKCTLKNRKSLPIKNSKLVYWTSHFTIDRCNNHLTIIEFEQLGRKQKFLWYPNGKRETQSQNQTNKNEKTKTTFFFEIGETKTKSKSINKFPSPKLKKSNCCKKEV